MLQSTLVGLTAASVCYSGGDDCWKTQPAFAPSPPQLVAKGQFCGKPAAFDGETKQPTAGKCYEYCQGLNKSGASYQGYWWKAWGGGYCGCCKAVNSASMTHNWPDATTWKLPPTGHDLIGAGRFCSSGKGYSGEFKASIDQTRAKCESENLHSNKGYVGYWWKAWGGGYGGNFQVGLGS